MNEQHDLLANAPPSVAQFGRQSYAGVVRQHLLHIERGIHQGIRHEPIRRELAAMGFEASIGTFRKSLSRARIWWRLQLQLRRSQQSDLPVQAQHTAISPDIGARAATTGAYAAERGLPVPALRPAPQSAPEVVASQVRQAAPKAVTPSDLEQFFKRKSVFQNRKGDFL